MSGEYYCNEGPVTKFYKDYENVLSNAVSNKEKTEPKVQDLRLHDIEEQLEMAEDRCNTLKDQLDYMKQVYGVNRHAPKIRKISNISTGKKSSSDDKLSGSSLTDDATEKESLKIFPKRQNSNAIRTDNSGASVKTINHILNGITDSVNRLSELHVQISESPRSRIVRSTEISPHSIIEMNIRKSQSASDQAENQKNTTDESGVIVEGSPRINIKSKNAKKKSREPKLLNKKPLASHLSIRKTAKAEKRTKTASIKSATLDRDLYTMRKRSYLNSIKPNAQTHKLVEIYHNNAAKNSDSDETTGKPKQQVVNDNNQSFVNDIPPLEIPDKIENVGKVQNYGNSTCPRLAVIQNGRTDVCYDPPEAPRTEGSCFSKNYELPTIASKMKQVAKSYLTSFNLKAIPFCAAISTSPSHNIGINIQQVMNIIKTRQSVNGISPTLAHNIGLAAERINSRPLSTLVSTINSKSGYRTSRCPLSKTNVNYQQLQEMAKGIPEETAEEVQEEADSPAMKTVIITGPSGDVEIKNRNVPVWAADSKYSDQCTCIPQQGVDFQQIVSKYNRRNTPLTAKTVDTQVENRVSKFSISNKRRAQNPQKKVQYSKNGYNTNTINPAVETQETSDPNPLQGREKNLKIVLTNLHNEFESLNKRYEHLSHKANPEDTDTLKELEAMETELNKKEEEITMVMALYKEVLALKQQIKNLKARASQASINIQDQKESSVKFKEYNNPQAAFHLTKLLRQIQHYQLRYKNDVNGV